MNTFIRILLGLTASLLSVVATAIDNNLSVFIEYRHGFVHVKYPLRCSYGFTSTLTSAEGAPISWRVEVTPKSLGNGLVSVVTVVSENDAEVSRSEVINKIGEEAKITSTGPDGDKFELTIQPGQ